MMQHVSIERMHEALDGLLSSAEIDVIDDHLLECEPCRHEYARLSEIVTAVRALPKVATTPEGAWQAIAARIGDGSRSEGTEATVVAFPGSRQSVASTGVTGRAETGLRRSTFSLTLGQLAAAAALVAVLSAGVVFVALGGSRSPSPEVAGQPAPFSGGAAARAVSMEGEPYGEVISELEEIVAQGRGVLTPETLLTIEESLRTVDEAIADVEQALASDPGSDLLLRLLATHRRTKLGVLQRAAAAVQAQT